MINRTVRYSDNSSMKSISHKICTHRFVHVWTVLIKTVSNEGLPLQSQIHRQPRITVDLSCSSVASYWQQLPTTDDRRLLGGSLRFNGSPRNLCQHVHGCKPTVSDGHFDKRARAVSLGIGDSPHWHKAPSYI